MDRRREVAIITAVSIGFLLLNVIILLFRFSS